MKDPVRWKEDQAVSAEIRDLLAQGAPAPEMHDDARRAAAAAAASLVTGQATAAAAGGGVLSKLVLGLAVLAAVGGGVWVATDPTTDAAPPPSEPATERPAPARQAQAAPPAPPVAPAPVPVDEPEATPSTTDEAVVEPVDVPRAPRAARPAPPVREVPEDSLAAEAALLERARATLSSDPGASLRLVREHAREHPRGQLIAERELIAVDALLRLGRRAEAERRGAALVAQRGMYARRVQRMLERSAEPE